MWLMTQQKTPDDYVVKQMNSKGNFCKLSLITLDLRLTNMLRLITLCDHTRFHSYRDATKQKKSWDGNQR